jgi:hypothetical protein
MVPVVPFFAKISMFKGVLVGLMDALPWGEVMKVICHEWGVADKVR